jgi:hypothetical protein
MGSTEASRARIHLVGQHFVIYIALVTVDMNLVCRNMLFYFFFIPNYLHLIVADNGGSSSSDYLPKVAHDISPKKVIHDNSLGIFTTAIETNGYHSSNPATSHRFIPLDVPNANEPSTPGTASYEDLLKRNIVGVEVRVKRKMSSIRVGII